jgi:23S rRNA (cytidine1920-2'-O)/16S rRNA (cytidine1409-2'-O)-methyltransferase
MQQKVRLDRLLVERGLVESRERAAALVMAGSVDVDGQRVDKPGRAVPSDASIRLRADPFPYVGRGGVKLAAALDHFEISASGRTVLDVGASTGGFTDCMLQRGAALVFAVDVGYGQLDMRLRRNPRVRVLERRNIRYMRPADLDPRPDLAAIDVSFISLRIVLPVVATLLSPPREVLTLVKPQFEVGRKEVGKGGLVKDPALHQRVLNEIAALGAPIGLEVGAPFPSPIRGAKGNREFFLHFRQPTGGGL